MRCSRAERNAEPAESAPAGHGRNGAAAFTRRAEGCRRTRHAPFRRPLPGVRAGEKCTARKSRATLVRFVGQAPLEATVFEMERLRCNACGQVFTADEPEGAGAEKYDETAAAMIALLKYGTGVPFKRLERLRGTSGNAAAGSHAVGSDGGRGGTDPAGAGGTDPAGGAGQRDAQRRHRHADSAPGARAGRQADGHLHQRHRIDVAGPDHRAVLHRMAACGREPRRCAEAARTRTAGAHPDVRRAVAQHAEAAMASRPCWRTASRMEDGSLWRWRTTFRKNAVMCWRRWAAFISNDALAREQRLSPEERLRFHQEHSGPLMKELHEWMEAQLAEHKTEPNSGLGKAISYLLNHWRS